MLLPSQVTCARVIHDMQFPDFYRQLTAFEQDFVNSNRRRDHFTDRQREVIAGFLNKYEFPAIPTASNPPHAR